MTYLNQFHKEDSERKMRKIAECGAIADELYRLCELYEAQRGDSQPHVSPFLPLYAFTGFDGRTIMPILKQDFV